MVVAHHLPLLGSLLHIKRDGDADLLQFVLDVLADIEIVGRYREWNGRKE